ncbi:unnamed protein product [Effrenium voratum]|nr:unnamed protein product [Effrenium voratum]
MEKGNTREKLFEAFIKVGCEKDAFLKVVTMEKSHEKTHELEEEGGFYTPEEMKELLHYKQTFGP